MNMNHDETTILENIVCKKCDNTLPPHTIKEHMDISNSIHNCPHKMNHEEIIVENINCKKCVMCQVKLNEDEESVYSCKKCYNKYPFWIISEKKSEQMTTKITKRKIYESLVKQGNQDDIEMLLKKDDKHVDAVLKAFNIKVHF